nr:efflux RND transporter periplasmic adaptor subunit [Methylosinus sp. Sm6]
MAAESALRIEGVVAPRETREVGARVAGVVSSVRCDAGMHVEAGRLCAEIDPRPFRAAVDRKTRELQAAQARLDGDQARRGAARDALERAQGATRSSGVARLRRSVETRERRVERASAGVARAEAELAATRIVSPIEGTIRSRNVEPGREVAAKAKTPLFVVAPDSVRIAARIGAAQSGRIVIGDKVVITVDALPGQSFDGTVTKIEPLREGAEAIVDMTARDPRHALEPGMAANARISKQ